MSDLVRRLRDHENEGVTHSDRFQLRNEAADDIERLRKALKWYEEEAAAIARNLVTTRPETVLASITVLSLDGGKRAHDALAQSPNCGQTAPELQTDKPTG